MERLENIPFKTKCFVCGKPVEMEVNNHLIDKISLIYDLIARNKGWAYSQSANGAFLCCEKCYPVCFDTSIGQVGFLRDEYDEYRIKI